MSESSEFILIVCTIIILAAIGIATYVTYTFVHPEYCDVTLHEINLTLYNPLKYVYADIDPICESNVTVERVSYFPGYPYEHNFELKGIGKCYYKSTTCQRS